MFFRKELVVVFVTYFMFIGHADAENSSKSLLVSPLNIGDVLTVDSKVLGEQRILNVYVPASYADSSDKQYPVIYVLDGSISEDFIHISGLVQFTSFPWLNIAPESIVVGIANVDRKRDFTFVSSDKLDQKELPTSGGASKFIEFIDSEVQTTINQRYRVNGQNTLIGQSLGGLLATQILFEHPHMFANYIIISPSLWWDQESLLKKTIDTSQSGLKIYIGVANEGSTMIRLATTLTDKLNHAYKRKDAAHFSYFKQNGHADTLHLAVYDALKILFSSNEK
jgi:predicted alpha/beta superfamily hydrolase